MPAELWWHREVWVKMLGLTKFWTWAVFLRKTQHEILALACCLYIVIELNLGKVENCA